MSKFVPNEFDVPVCFSTPDFYIRPLIASDNELDYLAVTNSMAYRGGEDMEVKSLTKEKNLENLQRHEREFQNREAFAYTVLSADQKKCLGCIYISPSTRGDFDAEIWMWVTVESYGRGLDEKLYQSVKDWVDEDWPFKKVVYPGRNISWDEWDRQK